MGRQIITTKDGSHTISIPEMNVTYHSLHGAIQESMHVFIEAGLKYLSGDAHILELGFGTGLNALLTLMEKERRNVSYETIETVPISVAEAATLNYCGQLKRSDLQHAFEQLHQCPWEEQVTIQPGFIFQKHHASLLEFSTSNRFNLVYFDAFSPSVQPELWTAEVFKRIYDMMHPNGILVTYCSKTVIRRAMESAGFYVEKIPGPYGKREMVRAVASDK